MEIDPSILKLLEEDEDEIMHSGAILEAFLAALNRDMQANTSTSQPPSHSNTGNNKTGAQTINLHNQQSLQSVLQTYQRTLGGKQVSSAALMLILLPQLNKEKVMQLNTLFAKVQRNEMTKEVFFRHMGNIVGNAMLRLAVNNTPSQVSSNQFPLPQHTSSQENDPRMPSFTASPHSLAHLQKTSMNSPSSSFLNKGLECSSFSSVAYTKQKSVDGGAQLQYKPHSSTPQGLSAAQIVQGNANPETSKDKPSKRQRINSGFTATNNRMPMNSVSTSLSTQFDCNAPNLSVAPPVGVSVRTPQRTPSIGQKEQLEASLGSTPPPPSKKQKVSWTVSDQSIEELNDVTAVSGINLQEEVEQLLPGIKNNRVSEAARRVVHEEERGILLRIPLQKKLAGIVAKHGLKNISNDVERCLSLSVEERMRGLIRNLFRLSKQRADAEGPMHLKHTTSDVRQQINRLNSKAKEEWDRKQVEVEKLQKLLEPEDSGVDGGKQKNKGQVKSVKPQEVDKMMAAAANVTARAAVGGDDILLKWQLMAEQARQKREKANQDADKRGLLSPHAEAIKRFGRSQVQTRVAQTISVKDLISVLEREPQLSKSAMIYRLYEKSCSKAAG